MRITSVLFFCLAVLMAPLSQGAISRNYERVFTEQELRQGGLGVELFSGKITVLRAEQPGVHVTITAEVDSELPEQAERILKDLKPVMEVREGGARVAVAYARDIHWTFEEWPPLRLSVVIQVPAKLNLDLRTEDGSIEVAQMAGAMRARCRSGQIYFRGVDGSVDAETESGDIVISNCTGDVKLRSIHGGLKVGPVGGFADLLGHGGELEIDAAGHGVRAESNGADLTVAFRTPVAGPAELRAFGGNIYITVDKKVACSLDLRSSVFGKVSLKREGILPLVISSGAFGKRRLQATINGGGPKIDAQADGGSIIILPELGE